jgi:hypothetical protein
LRYKVYRNPDSLDVAHALSDSSALYPQSPELIGTQTEMVVGAYQHVRYAEAVPDDLGRVAKNIKYMAELPLRDDTREDFYAQELTGFFIAPFNAQYSFYIAADDSADIALSLPDGNETGPMGLRVVAGVSAPPNVPSARHSAAAWYAGPCAEDLVLSRFGHDCSISEPVELNAGSLTYFRVRHVARAGGDWLRLGLRIHAPFGGKEGKYAAGGSRLPEIPRVYQEGQSFFETQKITLSLGFTRETHHCRIDWAVGGYVVIFVDGRFGGDETRYGYTEMISVRATPEDFAEKIWAVHTTDTWEGPGYRVLACKPEVTRFLGSDGSVGVDHVQWKVVFPCPRPISVGEDGPKEWTQHANFALLSVGIMSVTGKRFALSHNLVAHASDGLEGYFRLGFEGLFTRPILCTDWESVRGELNSLPGLANLEVLPAREVIFDAREGWTMFVRLIGVLGDAPMLEMDASNLIGPGVALKVETIQAGVAEDIFLDVIPADWFRTAHPRPQVVVTSNGVANSVASTEGAAFQYFTDLTPMLDAVGPRELFQDAQLTLDLSNVMAEANAETGEAETGDAEVFVGPSPCAITSSACVMKACEGEAYMTRTCIFGQDTCEPGRGKLWRIVCRLQAGLLGTYNVTVRIGSQGFAIPGEGSAEVEVHMGKATISASAFESPRGSWLGGTPVAISGFGMQGSNSCSMLTVGGQPMLEVDTLKTPLAIAAAKEMAAIASSKAAAADGFA